MYHFTLVAPYNKEPTYSTCTDYGYLCLWANFVEPVSSKRHWIAQIHTIHY
jgi:hypothetical protein